MIQNIETRQRPQTPSYHRTSAEIMGAALNDYTNDLRDQEFNSRKRRPAKLSDVATNWLDIFYKDNSDWATYRSDTLDRYVWGQLRENRAALQRTIGRMRGVGIVDDLAEETGEISSVTERAIKFFKRSRYAKEALETFADNRLWRKEEVSDQFYKAMEPDKGSERVGRSGNLARMALVTAGVLLIAAGSVAYNTRSAKAETVYSPKPDSSGPGGKQSKQEFELEKRVEVEKEVKVEDKGERETEVKKEVKVEVKEEVKKEAEVEKHQEAEAKKEVKKEEKQEVKKETELKKEVREEAKKDNEGRDQEKEVRQKEEIKIETDNKGQGKDNGVKIDARCELRIKERGLGVEEELRIKARLRERLEGVDAGEISVEEVEAILDEVCRVEEKTPTPKPTGTPIPTTPTPQPSPMPKEVTPSPTAPAEQQQPPAVPPAPTPQVVIVEVPRETIIIERPGPVADVQPPQQPTFEELFNTCKGLMTFETLVAQLSHPNVRFDGHMSRDNIGEMLAAFDRAACAPPAVAVQPSPTQEEAVVQPTPEGEAPSEAGQPEGEEQLQPPAEEKPPVAKTPPAAQPPAAPPVAVPPPAIPFEPEKARVPKTGGINLSELAGKVGQAFIGLGAVGYAADALRRRKSLFGNR